MIGGMSGVESNIIPYGLYFGIRSDLKGLNLIGLKRKDLKREQIYNIKSIFIKIFKKTSNIESNISNLSNEEKNITEIREIVEFIKLNYKRGICRYTND